MFQNIGGAAYNKGLDKTIRLLEILDNPHHKFRSIHIAGTNGKGSTSSMLAAVLQSSGYKTGLYTSPHLKSFTERIRIDGMDIPEDYIVEFVNELKPSIEIIRPSFFEMTVAMAFRYFADLKIDVAVIEVGMGGRLDSTNVISPEVCLITNISYDHQAYLGSTLKEIAGEKAGIIKPGVPVIISEYTPETRQVFEQKAKESDSPVIFVSDKMKAQKTGFQQGKMLVEIYSDNHFQFQLIAQLTGNYQLKNIPAVLTCCEILKKTFPAINNKSIRNGISEVCTLTGLKGRWQILSEDPLTICDTGHNEAGIREVLNQLQSIPYKKLHMIIGMVKDKDVSKILQMLPPDAEYYFCQPGLPRALDADMLASEAASFGLKGTVIREVNNAIETARNRSDYEDLIFIGGSTFVVAEINEL
jgi:dihydrofolate synthase/folylpolyglutamate synthase